MFRSSLRQASRVLSPLNSTTTTNHPESHAPPERVPPTGAGSPVGPPRSPLGKLVTILYGTLGVPLLVIAVARSGLSLARSSLNALIILRHYCFALPYHYLCCSCNLFACLRWLSWCCCCCCCSYLCCLSEQKQKCCDSSRAPKLRLFEGGRKWERSRHLRQQSSEPMQAPAAESTSFVIGFQLASQLGDSQRVAKQPAEQQKSVRFSSGHGEQNERYENKSTHSNGSSEDSNEQRNDSEASPFHSHGIFATSLGVLLAYVACGAYYISRTQQLSMVDALFACYSMLATSSLPDSFELSATTKLRNPLAFYHKWMDDDKLSSGRLAGNASATKLTPSMISRARQEGPMAHSSETLLLASIYLLVGLNLISACSHYARLWLARPTIKQQLDAQQVAEKVGKHDACNGLGPALHPLVGSFDRTFHGASSQCGTNAISCQVVNRQDFATSQMGQQLDEEKQRAELAELFVMPGDAGGGGGRGGAGGGELSSPMGPVTCHSDGSFAASEGQSSSTAPRSLCAHHQSALALQTLANSSAYKTNQLQLGGLHTQADEANHLLGGQTPTIRSSSSVIQLANLMSPDIKLTDNRLAYDCDTNSLRFKHHPQAHLDRPNGFATLGHNQSVNEQDSSPNTFDTTNSQTISSLSSRAVALKGAPRESNQTSDHQDQGSVGSHRDQSGRLIWFGNR